VQNGCTVSVNFCQLLEVFEHNIFIPCNTYYLKSDRCVCLLLGLKPEKATHVACGRAHTLLSTSKLQWNPHICT